MSEGDTTRMMRRDAAVKAPDQTVMQRILFWKLAMTKVSGKALLAGGNSVVTSLNGAQWADFTSSQRLVAYVSAYGAMWLVIDAFLDNTMHELKMTQADLAKIASETTTTESETNIKVESKT